MKKILITLAVIMLVLALGKSLQRAKKDKTNDLYVSKDSIVSVLKDAGGRVDWSESENLIAFDRRDSDGFYDVFVMDPDGSNEKCITCNKTDLPNKNMGNPAWHPTGNYLVFQAQKTTAIFNDLATPGKGVGNDLWVTDLQGGFWKLHVSIGTPNGVLHPHFSHDGTKLIWAQLIESQGLWGKWSLNLADFSISGGTPVISNINTLRPGTNPRFFETHGFTLDDKKIIFSATAEGQSESGFDIYLMDIASGKLQNLTNSPDEWDEHAQLSPKGDKLIWASNKDIGGLNLDLWEMNLDGSDKKRITYFKSKESGYYVEGVGPADSTFSPDGQRLAVYVIVDKKETSGKIFIIDLSFSTVYE